MSYLQKLSFIKGSASTHDLHPDNKKIAASNDNELLIYELPKDLNFQKEKTLGPGLKCSFQFIKDDQYVLSKITGHTKTINIVRFSPNGKFIATGSVDKSVGFAVFEGNVEGGQYRENWRTTKLFRNHTEDVLGVEWSPDSRYLASCSVDNKVFVYDVSRLGKNFEI